MNVPQGKKFDGGKLRWSLFPWLAAQEVVKVFMFGAKKYGDHNWLDGLAYDRFADAIQRHWFEWFVLGRDVDEESGFHPLAHLTCCALMILTYHLLGMGKTLDTRRNGNEKK